MNEVTFVVPDWFMYMMLVWFILVVIQNVLAIALSFVTWYIGQMTITNEKKP